MEWTKRSEQSQYNGKEWNDDFGLGWNDYGARFYDPAMARWVAVDPLAEKFSRHSPYNYGMNSPVVNIDPDGCSAMPGQETNEAEDYNNRPTVASLINKAIAQGGHWSANGKQQPTGSGLTGNYIFDADGKFIKFSGTQQAVKLIVGDAEYSFNDELTDVGSIEYNTTKPPKVFKLIKFIYNLSNGDIDQMMKESNVKKGRGRLSIAWSSVGGELDFSVFHLSVVIAKSSLADYWDTKDILNDKGPLFLMPNSSIAYNLLDAGNFLWGNAMHRMGYSLEDSLKYAMKYDKKDPKADQIAITNGWNAFKIP